MSSSPAGLLPRFASRLANYDFINRPVLRIGMWSSSIGGGPTLANPSVDAIGNYLPHRIAQVLDPGGLVNWDFVNFYHNGGVMADFNGDYSSAKSTYGHMDLVIVAPAMNDEQISNFNFGQCGIGYQNDLTAAIGSVRGDGADILFVDMPTLAVVNQGAPADPYTTTWTMNWPTVHTPPVAASQLWPPGSDYMRTTDFVGNGGPSISLSTQKLLLSQWMRGIATKNKVALLPILFPYWAKTLQDQVTATGNMAAAEQALFSPAGMPVHFNDTANNAAVKPAVNEWCDALRDGFVSAGCDFNFADLVSQVDYEVDNDVSSTNPLHVPTGWGECGTLLVTAFQNGVGMFTATVEYQNDGGTMTTTVTSTTSRTNPVSVSASDPNVTITPNFVQTRITASYIKRMVP